MNGRPINQDRQLALSLGFQTYQGSVHEKCGTTERYTKGAGCVHCARAASREGLEARRVLKLQALDNSTRAVAKPDEAEAIKRFEQDLDDLM